PLRCQAITVSGATPIANRSTTARAKPTGLDQPNRDGAYDRGSNVARPEADVGEQESLLAERHEPGNNLAETKVESAWPGKVTGCGSVNATISICTEFLAGTTSLHGEEEHREHRVSLQRH